MNKLNLVLILGLTLLAAAASVFASDTSVTVPTAAEIEKQAIEKQAEDREARSSRGVEASREEIKNVPMIERSFQGYESQARNACRAWLDELKAEFRTSGLTVLRQDCVPFVSKRYEAGYRGVVYFFSK